MRLSEIQVNRSALVHNIRALRGITPAGTALVAVVKGNAYGHGLVEVARALDGEVDAFQVDDIEELALLRQVTSRRALVLGYVAKAEVEEAIHFGSELAVYDLERLSELQKVAQRLEVRPKVHLKIDALLGRQGIEPGDLSRIIDALRLVPEIRVVSAYAHFANIEDTTDLGHAFQQIEVFERAWNQMRDAGWSDLGRHLSATSGLMTVESGNDLVRLGLGIYGMYPSLPLARTHADLGLKPVMRWVSHLAQVKTLPARHPVGYGLTYITPKEMKIGVVPQGYADGYDRGLSNSGEVLVRGIRCAVLGRVAMNMFTIDLSNVPDAHPEDEVVLLGEQGSERIEAEELASRLGTINYEITTRVSPLLPRRLVSSSLV